MLALDCWNGNSVSVQSYISATGATYPVLRNAGFLQGPNYYNIAYDNYVVVDAQGIVRYTSVGEPFTQLGRFNGANLRAAITQNLPSGVDATTWSVVKQLYRAP